MCAHTRTHILTHARHVISLSLSWWGAQADADTCSKVDGRGTTTITVAPGAPYYVQIHDGQIKGDAPPASGNPCEGKGYGGGCGAEFGNGGAQSGWCKYTATAKECPSNNPPPPADCKSDTAWAGAGERNFGGNQWGFYTTGYSSAGDIKVWAGREEPSQRVLKTRYVLVKIIVKMYVHQVPEGDCRYRLLHWPG